MTKKIRDYQSNYIAAPEMAVNFGVSISTIYRWVKDGQLPAPVRIAGRTKRWSRSTVEALDKEILLGERKNESA